MPQGREMETLAGVERKLRVRPKEGLSSQERPPRVGEQEHEGDGVGDVFCPSSHEQHSLNRR